MSATTISAADTDLTDVGGVGTKTAQSLLDKFGSDDVAFDAVQSVPAWVKENIDGIGAGNLANLRAYAADRGHHDQTDRSLSSLRATRFKGRYDNHFYACGQREDNVCLFYTGYYQGREYRTSFSGRQNLHRKYVNTLAWTFYSFSERDHIVLEYETRNKHRNGEKQYFADVIDDYEWKSITDTGMVYYQRGRNYEPDHYPATTKGMKSVSDLGGEPKPLIDSLELVGITSDRIAIYRKRGTNAVFKFVKGREDGVLRRLYGYTRFKTDREYDLGEFGTLETFVKTLDEKGEWKTYAGDAYVTEEYQQYL